MKLYTTLIGIIMLAAWSCEAPGEKQQETEITEGPVQWVTYQGSQGPGNGKESVLVSGDEEYRSEEALPQLGKILATQHGFTCTVLFAQDPENPGLVDPNYLHNIPGLEKLQSADLMYIFTRFRALPDSQMQYIEDYLMAGKPVIGIRTATHAFRFEDTTHNWRHYGNYYTGNMEAWQGGFGRAVLGERWVYHHGHHKHQSTRGIIAPEAQSHPITKGIEDGAIWGSTDVYGVRLPLPGDSQPIILGQVVDREGEYDEEDRFYGLRPTDQKIATVNPAREDQGDPNDPMMPVAWIKSYQLPGGSSGTAFTSTIGASVDLLDEEVRRLFVNATYHLLDMDVPEAASVELVGAYEPSSYAFHDDAYWDEKGLKVEDFLME